MKITPRHSYSPHIYVSGNIFLRVSDFNSRAIAGRDSAATSSVNGTTLCAREQLVVIPLSISGSPLISTTVACALLFTAGTVFAVSMSSDALCCSLFTASAGSASVVAFCRLAFTEGPSCVTTRVSVFLLLFFVSFTRRDRDLRFASA